MIVLKILRLYLYINRVIQIYYIISGQYLFSLNSQKIMKNYFKKDLCLILNLINKNGFSDAIVSRGMTEPF